ncbi:MAG: permease-like cell division protein FtsX [Proteobacteria bacterium]|nr:permease-like cell division protein FtsX [Pseudomonadota bacterium]MBU1712020.1 permease-like cell division protein FtsX [Pseudomonadota bacterium]
MISLYFKHALRDIGKNRFVNAVSIITIALSVIITCSFVLFFINTSEILTLWKKGVRIMAYLYLDVPAEKIPEIQKKISGLYSVEDVRFISKEEAFDVLKEQMKRQSSLLENLKENPLPNAFEIRMIASSQTWEKIENLASQIQSIPQVEEVEYGQRWLARFSYIINLFKLSGYALGILFSVASVFIVANTVRLVLYSRRDEIEIMRLVGASDGFIKVPLYIEGIILGALGGIIGLIVLFTTFISITSNIDQGITSGAFQISFFSYSSMLIILISSMFVGWFGCFLSLKHIIKREL